MISFNPRVRSHSHFTGRHNEFRQPVPGYTAILTPDLRLQEPAEDPDSSLVPLNEQCNLELCPALSFPACEMRALGKMVCTGCWNSDVQSFPQLGVGHEAKCLSSPLV